jgi:hypothetical protein
VSPALPNGLPSKDREVGKIMIVFFLLGNLIAVSQDAFQISITVATHGFPWPAYVAFAVLGWMEWILFLMAFPGSYLLVLASHQYKTRMTKKRNMAAEEDKAALVKAVA